MARLQILELPEGSGDDRPPYLLIIDQVDDELAEDIARWPDDISKRTGARHVLCFPGTIDIPANEVPVGADGNPLFRAQVEEQIEHTLSDVARAANGGRHLAQERTGIARDMDRLAKWKNELTDALGMDRTRDWDDIRNAARGLRKERDTQTAELERLRAGEEPVTERGVTLTPGQWIHQWNKAAAEKRLDMAAQIQDGMTRSNNCFMADHEAQIERLRAEVGRLSSEPTTGTPDA